MATKAGYEADKKRHKKATTAAVRSKIARRGGKAHPTGKGRKITEVYPDKTSKAAQLRADARRHAKATGRSAKSFVTDPDKVKARAVVQGKKEGWTTPQERRRLAKEARAKEDTRSNAEKANPGSQTKAKAAKKTPPKPVRKPKAAPKPKSKPARKEATSPPINLLRRTSKGKPGSKERGTRYTKTTSRGKRKLKPSTKYGKLKTRISSARPEK